MYRLNSSSKLKYALKISPTFPKLESDEWSSNKIQREVGSSHYKDLLEFKSPSHVGMGKLNFSENFVLYWKRESEILLLIILLSSFAENSPVC